MNYSFKVTTGGRELLAALLATGKELEITRVAVGSGRVAEDVNLADMTDLVQYVAEGTIAQRRHVDNVLFLTVQYSSNSTPGLGAFYLAEFIVQAKHPVTGESVTILYATLGDYIQPVNAYSETMAPDIRNYPLALAISDEIVVNVSTPAGLVTYDDLMGAVEQASKDVVASIAAGGIKKSVDFVIPADAWVENPEGGTYPLYYDLIDEDITASMIPDITVAEDSLETVKNCGMSATATSYLGYVRVKCAQRPDADVVATCNLLVIGPLTESGGAGGAYSLPVASAATLGGVKVKPNSGLTIDGEGNLAVDNPSEEEINAAIEDVFGE